jgi:hypothetical protein
MPLLLPPGLTPPRLATPRNFDRPTYGGHAAAIAASLGKPFIPLHAYIADVALEIDPTTGTFYYDRVILTAQRQVGKTVLDQSCSIQNATMGRDRFIWYTAQSGGHAYDKFLEMMEVWDSSPLLSPMARKPRRSNGSAWLKFHNGSILRPHPPTADALHGKQIDRDTLDEAWAFSTAQAAALKQASVAPKLTRRKLTGHRPQSWELSTEGTIESTYWNEVLDSARAGELGERTAIFDWGLRDDDDPMDLDVVASRHPGYGYLFEMEELETFRDGEFKGMPGEFARAFGNVRTGAGERVIPRAAWLGAKLDVQLPAGRVCFGAAYGIDGIDAAITASQLVAGETVTAIVERGWDHGTWWALDRLKELTERFADSAVVIDKYGPSASLHDDAELAGLPLLPVAVGDVSAASQKLLAGITNPAGATWRYKQHDALDKAAELATRRYIGDGAWNFGRRASVGSIAALEAANLSSWGIEHMPEPMALQLG